MTKKRKPDDEECPRCTQLEIALNRELDTTEQILKLFRDTAFPDVAAVHEKAAEILKQVLEYRPSVAPKRPGPRLRDPVWIITAIDRAVRNQGLTPKEVTEEYIADKLGITPRELQRKIARYTKLTGLTWRDLTRLISASSQPD